MIKNEEHAFKTFFKMLKDNSYPKVILLYGREQFLIDWAYGELVAKFINPQAKTLDLTIFDEEKIDINSITDAIETFPILSEMRLVVLSDFKGLKTEGNKQLRTDDELKFIESLEQIPQSTILIVKASEVDKRRKLYKAFDKYGKIFDFTALSESDLRSFIVKHFGIHGKKIEFAAVEQLIRNSGYLNKESEYTLYNLENDIKKISAYSDGNAVIAGDVMVFLEESLETNIFAMFDYISRSDINRAMLLLNSLLKNGVNEYQIIALLASQFELMLKVKELKEEGNTLSHIASTLKVHEFRVKKANEFILNYEKSTIIKWLTFVYNMDRSIKDGSMSASLLLELFISMSAVLKGK